MRYCGMIWAAAGMPGPAWEMPEQAAGLMAGSLRIVARPARLPVIPATGMADMLAGGSVAGGLRIVARPAKMPLPATMKEIGRAHV